MANTVRLPYSNTASNTPSTLGNGVLGINQADGKLFYRNASGVVTQFASGGGSVSVVEYATTASFPATGASATLYLATDSRRIYSWTGSVYAEVGAVSSSPTDSRWDLFLPGAPTSVSGSPGNNSATISWTAPTVLSQTPVTDYVVQYSTDATNWTAFADGVSSATNATVTGLTNGTAYYFRVAATNGVGTGPYSSASASVTAGGDTYYSSVSLLLHMDGTNGGTTFTDNSGTPKTVTSSGATTSTARSKFGTASGLFSSNYLSVPSNAGWGFGTGDFTVECWVYRTSAPASASIMGVGYTIGGFGFFIDSSNQINVTRPGTAIDFTFAAAVPLNAWSHLAITRSGTSLRCFVDGVQKGSTATSSTNYAQGELVIGMDGDKTNQAYAGNIDEFRITKGVARYTSNFTPSAIAFSNS